jgi:hypothetical protein
MSTTKPLVLAHACLLLTPPSSLSTFQALLPLGGHSHRVRGQEGQKLCHLAPGMRDHSRQGIYPD